VNARPSVVVHLGRLEGEPLSLFVGELDLRRLITYIEGYRACLDDAGLEDDYPAFKEWLASKRPEMRFKGWADVLLEESKGDHEGALRGFLDLRRQYLSER
jgi:hypothetical protein